MCGEGDSKAIVYACAGCVARQDKTPNTVDDDNWGATESRSVEENSKATLFTRVRNETAETPREMGARSREGGKHT